MRAVNDLSLVGVIASVPFSALVPLVGLSQSEWPSYHSACDKPAPVISKVSFRPSG